jgi:electron transport complex protein RnfC
MSLFKLGKLHVPHRKNTAGMAAVRMTPPESVLIPMSQHIGAPATPVVKAGDKVYVGTLIGEASGYVSANIHSSVSGTVKKIESYLASNGKSIPAVLIESDGEMTPDPAIAPPEVNDFESFNAAVRASGLIGLGGAGFPASVKLDAEKKGIIKKVIINAAECEPYITSDTRTMLDDTADVVCGIELLEKYLSAEEYIIGIESNKPECIAKMREVFANDAKLRVEALPSTYPQGAEKVLIFNTTGLVVPEGGLPSDVGCMVMNVTSLAFIAKYVKTGMPLVDKCVTVDGSAVKNPMNVIAPVGASIESIIEFTGGYSEPAGKVLYGGPMMGIAVYSTADPILKNTNAIVAMNVADALPKMQNPCIHCGRCVEACPIGLNPTAYAKAMNIADAAERAQRLTADKVNLCMECGSCSYVCPSARPLVENNRLGKAALRNAPKKN